MAIKFPAALLFAALLLAAGVAEGRPGGSDDYGSGPSKIKVWKAKAMLSGVNEVPGIAGSPAFGSFEITIGKTWEAIVSWELKFAKIANVSAAHIHEGEVGANGPVKAFLLNPPAGTVVTAGKGPKTFKARGTPYAFTALRAGWPATDTAPAPPSATTPAFFMEKVAAGLIYINVHTVQAPGGAIRGQLVLDN